MTPNVRLLCLTCRGSGKLAGRHCPECDATGAAIPSLVTTVMWGPEPPCGDCERHEDDPDTYDPCEYH